MKVSGFIPPVFYSVANRLSSTQSKKRVEQSIFFNSYSEALSQCGSYDDGDIAEVVRLKTEKYILGLSDQLNFPRDVQNLLILKEVSGDLQKMQVVELGGACGALFFFSEHHIGNKISRWTIVETEQMVQCAKKYFLKEKLKFVMDFAELQLLNEDKTLCVASGVLQYFPDPAKIIEDIFKKNFKYVYVSRQPLLIDSFSPGITIQKSNLLNHGPGNIDQNKYNKEKKTPITFLPESFLFQKAESEGYEIIYQFDEEPVQSLPGGLKYRTVGVLFKQN